MTPGGPTDPGDVPPEGAADDDVVARLVEDSRRYLRLRRRLGNAFLLLAAVFAVLAWAVPDLQHVFAGMAIGAAVGGLRLRVRDSKTDRANEVVEELGQDAH